MRADSVAIRATRAIRVGLPVVFAVVVLVGMARTLGSLISTPAVDIGAYRSVGHDALSLYLGQGLYHDPASTGYLGQLYTPLLTGVVALLDEVGVWAGWPIVLDLLGTAALAAMIGVIAWRAAGDRRPATIAGAAGMAGLAVWLANSMEGRLYYGWPDGVAWTFAFAGLLAGARAHRSRRAAALTVVALTLAFWSKQTTIAPIAGLVVWLVVLAYRRQRSWQFVAGLVAALAILNLVVFAALQLLTGGWELFFNFTLPTRQANPYGISTLLDELRIVLIIPALIALGLGAAALLGRRRLTLDGLGGLLGVAAAVGLPFALYFATKQGSYYNQYLGVTWELSGLAALAWGAARAGGKAAMASDVVVGLALAGALLGTAVGPNRYDLRQLRMPFASIPGDLRAVAKRGPLFDPVYTDLAPGRVYTDVYTTADVLAGDEQPNQLVQALLHRRFAHAVTYATALSYLDGFFNLYASAYGAYESNYFWKLDRVIAAGYGPAPGLPPGILERRAGPNRALPLGACFGPFQLAHRTWTIRAGGGMWCRTAPGTVTLTAAPAARSQLITKDACRASGTLRIAARRAGASVSLVAGSWAIAALRTPTGWRVSSRDGGPTTTRIAAGSWLSLDLGVGTGVKVGADRSAARISIYATPGAGVRVDTGGMRLS